MQRAVVAWADLVELDYGASFLQLLERSALVTDLGLVFERERTSLRLRFAGNAVSAMHRTIADSVLNGDAPLKPVARCHCIAHASGLNERCLRSLVLPFGRFMVVQFDA